jgi:hypothetical protein
VSAEQLEQTVSGRLKICGPTWHPGSSPGAATKKIKT